MSRQSIKTEIQEFKSNGGKFQFTFGETHLPVVYHEALGVMGVRVEDSEIFRTYITPHACEKGLICFLNLK